MMKLLILCVLVSGCNLAKKCADRYPCVETQEPTITTHIPADNKNYQPNVDSLKHAADSLGVAGDSLGAALARKQIEADAISKDCGDKVRDFSAQANKLRNQVQDLTRQIANLKASYKPCIPDTVDRKTTIRILDTAKLQVATDRGNKYQKMFLVAVVLLIVSIIAILALYFKNTQNGQHNP